MSVRINDAENISQGGAQCVHTRSLFHISTSVKRLKVRPSLVTFPKTSFQGAPNMPSVHTRLDKPPCVPTSLNQRRNGKLILSALEVLKIPIFFYRTVHKHLLGKRCVPCLHLLLCWCVAARETEHIAVVLHKQRAEMGDAVVLAKSPHTRSL